MTDNLNSGIGGGGFMLLRTSDGKYENIDFRETTPAAGGENMYEGNYVSTLNHKIRYCSNRSTRMAVSTPASPPASQVSSKD